MVNKVLKKMYRKCPDSLKTIIRGGPLRRPVQAFRYRKPANDGSSNKEIALLCKESMIRGAIHVVRKGAEEHLHSHKFIDGFWMVLKGRARFHGDNGVVIGEFDPLEGVLIPRNTRYWFESVGEQELEMLQVLAYDKGKQFDRHNHANPNFDQNSIKWVDCRVERSE